MSDVNPYAAPESNLEGERRGQVFALSREVRTLVTTTATLMIMAGVLELIPSAIAFATQEVSLKTTGTLALLGLVPAFVAFAGFTLQKLERAGNDRETLLAGFRQLYVAFLVKGVILLILVAFSALTFLGITAMGIF